MARMRRGDEHRSPEDLLPPELRTYDLTQWPSRSEWSRARATALFRLGVRRLPGLQAMVRRPSGGNGESVADVDGEVDV